MVQKTTILVHKHMLTCIYRRYKILPVGMCQELVMIASAKPFSRAVGSVDFEFFKMILGACIILLGGFPS